MFDDNDEAEARFYDSNYNAQQEVRRKIEKQRAKALSLINDPKHLARFSRSLQKKVAIQREESTHTSEGRIKSQRGALLRNPQMVMKITEALKEKWSSDEGSYKGDEFLRKCNRIASHFSLEYEVIREVLTPGSCFSNMIEEQNILNKTW